MESLYEEILNKITASEFVLVGIGSEFRAPAQAGSEIPSPTEPYAAQASDLQSVESQEKAGRINADGSLPEAGLKQDRLLAAYGCLKRLLRGKSYFILTENEDDLIFRSGLLDFLIAAPFAVNSPSDGEEQWKAYQNWLSATLGHSLCLLELGVGFSSPQVIRWPFEKIVEVHQQAVLIRIQEKFPQLGKQIADRGISVSVNSVEWLLSLE